MTRANIIALPAFSDNYIWLIEHANNNKVAVVDPGNAEVCINYCQQHNKQLSTILITHHHIDHVGGIDQLRAYCLQKGWPLTVYSPEYQPLANQATLPIPQKYHKHTDIVVKPGDNIMLEDWNLPFQIIDVSGHTLEHIAYLNDELIFSGDSLFSGGCGRRFEGTVTSMYNSLTTLAALAPKTKIYCAHEYTLANLTFALKVEPSNQKLKNYYDKVVALRAKKAITLPSNIGLELAINPFLRTHIEEIQTKVSEFAQQKLTTPQQVFEYLRKWKDVS